MIKEGGVGGSFAKDRKTVAGPRILVVVNRKRQLRAEDGRSLGNPFKTRCMLILFKPLLHFSFLRSTKGL